MANDHARTLPTLTYAGDPSPCEAHACRLCCFDTQMPLIDDDVERIQQHTGNAADAFSHVDAETGFRQLSNQDGHCVFLGDEGCTIYTARPAGCRLYPLVMDADTHQGRFDELCPHTRRFRIRPQDRVALRTLVDRLLDETGPAPAGIA